MSVGILIATRNRAPQLLFGLHSIEKQEYKDIPVLVVDDASTDNTQDVIRRYEHLVRSQRIERSNGYRRNPGAVLNIGHRELSADIVIEQGGEVCHVTDCVTPLVAVCKPGTVALARVHHGSPQEYISFCKMVQSGAYEFPADVTPDTYRTNGDTWKVPVVQGHRLYCGAERPAPFLFCGAIHRDDFEAVGGYNESLPARNDEDLANRLIARGVKFVFVGSALAFHLEHPKT
jgi:glycosyltransferase involved in cell wall biosynthesis